MKKWDGGGGKPPPKKQENLGEKLRRVAGNRGGQSTPVLPFPAQLSSAGDQFRDLPPPAGEEEEEKQQPGLCLTVSLPAGASARRLAASVWELHQYNLPITKMHHGGGGGGGSRRNHRNQQLHHHHHHQHHRHHLLEDNPDPSPASPDLGSASSLRRHVAATLMQHHRNEHAVRAVSPASYGSSSMEVAPYNPGVTPTSSIEFRGGIGETSYSLKTSTELLKVLNRIWSLEEQHAANVSLVRALKRELDLARAKIKELVRDRQSDRQQMEHLMNQIAQDKQGQVEAAVQSVRGELEDERKLRKRSETLHRKLARELYESKTSLATALRDLENERRSRTILEELCDEFAWGIKNYEQEMHSLKHVSPEKVNGSNYRPVRDGLVLHISESWLDERMQIKQATTPTKISIVEKLSSEIEAFLDAKRKGIQKVGSGSVVGPMARRRHSLESIPMNLATSAPPDDGDDEDDVCSGGADSPCFELDKPVARGKDENVNSTTKPDHGKKKLALQGTGRGSDSTSLQVKFEEQMAQAILGQEEAKAKTGEQNQVEITEEAVGFNSKYLDSLLKNHYLQTGNDSSDSVSKPVWKTHPSPVREWTTRLPTEDLESKEQVSLKSKLLEARTRGQRSGSRVKPNKVPF